MRKLLDSSLFWLGWIASGFLNLLDNFIKNKISPFDTVICGVAAILLIAIYIQRMIDKNE